MKKMEISVGILSPMAKVIVYSVAGAIEYDVINGYASESDVRAAVGNFNRDTYSYSYSGHYHSRKQAVDRLREEIKETEQLLEKLKFCLNATKKKEWRKI